MNKRFLVGIIVSVAFLTNLSAQKKKPWNYSIYDDKPVHFGFAIGLNTMDFNISNSLTSDVNEVTYNADLYQLQPGFNVQIITSFRLGDNFNVRFLPGMAFGTRKLDIKIYENRGNNPNIDTLEYSDIINSNIIIFPLLLKYRAARINNAAPYIVGGVNFMYDMAARKKYPSDEPIYVMLKPMDLALQIGAGFDFYLPYFKLGIDLSLSQGMLNVLNDNPHPEKPQYVNSISGIKSSVWMLSFHFE